MSGRFRKKPVVIEAVQWNPPFDGKARLARELDCPGVRSTSYEEIARILGTSGCSKEEPYWDWSVLGVIETLEGPHVACPGDWIITGVKGERYPCKPEMFEATYEAVEPDQ